MKTPRWLTRFWAPLLPEWRWVAALGVCLAGGAWVFFDMLEDLLTPSSLVPTDLAFHNALQAWRPPGLDRLMIFITESGDAAVVIAVALAAGLWLIYRKAWRALFYGAAAVAGGSLINTAIKAALHRQRPFELYSPGWSAFSFPSGHSTTNAVLYGFLVVLVARSLPMMWRVPVAAGAFVLVALIAFSRLYLGAHWLSDVAGGLSFGTAWTAALGLFYFRRPSEDIAPARLLGVVLVAFIVAAAVNISLVHAEDVLRYARTPH